MGMGCTLLQCLGQLSLPSSMGWKNDGSVIIQMVMGNVQSIAAYRKLKGQVFSLAYELAATSR